MTTDPGHIAHRRWRRLAEMASRVAQGAPVASPCQSVCVMDPSSGWCEGCMRSLDEIAAWSRMDAPTRLAVWAQLPERVAQRIAKEAAQ